MPRQRSIAPTGVRIEPDLKERLAKLGSIKQRTVHWLVLDAIESYVNAEEQAEKLRQETLSRWEEAEHSLTVANEQVIDWLKTWGTGKERKRPLCK